MNYLVKRSSIIASGEGDFGHVAEDEVVLSDARWVPVSERLPEEGVTVIAYRKGTVSLMWREDERGWVYTDGASGATPSHWTPLLPGPEEA